MTPNEELAHEEHVAQILSIRSRGRPSHWWEATGLTAIAGSLVGALLGFGGSYLLKEQEFRDKLRLERVQEMQKAIVEANEALSSMLKANEERFLIATSQMKDLDLQQQTTIARETNRLQQLWRLQRESAEVGAILAFDGDPVISGAWNVARDSLERYTDCVEKFYGRFRSGGVPSDMCAVEKSGTSRSVHKLRKQFT